MNFLTETVLRIKGDSPMYFKHIRRFCAAYAIAAGVYMTADQTLKLPTPQNILTYLGYSIAITTAIAAFSMLPVTSAPVEPVKQDV